MRCFANRLGMVLSFIFFISSMIEAVEIPFDYGGQHYIIESSGKTWLNAKTAVANHAAYMGQMGNLAIINSAGENTAVYNAQQARHQYNCIRRRRRQIRMAPALIAPAGIA